MQLLTAHRRDCVLKQHFSECLLKNGFFLLPPQCWRSLLTNKILIGHQTKGRWVSKRSICKSSIMKFSSKNKLLNKPPCLNTAQWRHRFVWIMCYPHLPPDQKAPKARRPLFPAVSQQLRRQRAVVPPRCGQCPEVALGFQEADLQGLKQHAWSGKPKERGERCLDIQELNK